MAKLIELPSGLKFKTISGAAKHFKKLLHEQDLNEPFTGDDDAHVRAAFEGYCAKTNWPIRSRPTTFYPTHERGAGYTTRCYGVSFEDGTNDTFSMATALSAIAK